MSKRFDKYIRVNAVQTIVPMSEYTTWGTCAADEWPSVCLTCLVADSSGREWKAELDQEEVVNFINGDRE